MPQKKQILSEEKSQETKVFNLIQIALATTLGVYGGIYMMSKNYEAFWKKDLAQKTLTHGSIFCLLFAFVFFILGDTAEVIPDQAYLSAIVIAFLLIAFLDQRKDIEKITKKSGSESWLKAIGISIFSFFTFILLFIVMGVSFELIKKFV